ncbi:GDP-L-fucose synthase [Spirochaetia bacterium 38H-sp]|uniref:GDP-L-fucose synthase n=1 Tax=Rarispira pelagica TaxID=3141764 RepID=A0ABU9U9W5_9SPIR
MDKESRIYIAGHRGLVGSAVLKKLQQEGYGNIITRTHSELDLTQQSAVEEFFESEKPDVVILCAAKVGGILANDKAKSDFFYINSMIANNVIHSAYKYGVKKLINLGSSCIYPRECPQPIKEEYLLSGPLEKTNEGYALAKIGALKMCWYYAQEKGCDFISAMPTNLYGPNDNFDLESSHVLPALIRKFYEAKQKNADVILWGDGSPYREFLFVDDLADAIVFLMENVAPADIGECVNIGTGEDITIKELANQVADIVGFKGSIVWDKSKPNGTPRKLLDVSRINSLGWYARTSLIEGIEITYKWFIDNMDKITR